MKLIIDKDHKFKLQNMCIVVNTKSLNETDRAGSSIYRIALSINNVKVTDLIPDIKSLFPSDDNSDVSATIDMENGTPPFEFKFGRLISVGMYTNESGFFLNLGIARPPRI